MNLKEYYKALLSEALLNEATAARLARRDRAFQKAHAAARGGYYEGDKNRSAASNAAYHDYSVTRQALERSLDRRGGSRHGSGLDAVRGAGVALARKPSLRGAAEREAVERFRNRGIVGGSPVIRAAALAGKPLGPNLRTLLDKATEMSSAAKSSGPPT